MQNVSKNIVIATVFVLPLFFLSLTTEFYDFNKQMLLFAAVVVILILSWINYSKSKSLSLTLSALNIPVVLFAVAALLSLFINSPNKTEAMFFPLGAGSIVLMTLWYAAVSNKIQVQNSKAVTNALVISATVLSIIALLQYANVGSAVFGKKYPVFSVQNLESDWIAIDSGTITCCNFTVTNH